MNTLTTALVGLAIFAWFLYRQTIQRPVTRGDLTIPAILAFIISFRYLNGASSGIADAEIVFGGGAFGLATGLLAGQVIRVWRDAETGLVYQRGGWRYVALFIVLLGLRIVARVALERAGITADASVLNDAFIAMIVGNFLGRAASVGLRTLALHGWNYDAIPSSRRRPRERHTRHSF